MIRILTNARQNKGSGRCKLGGDDSARGSETMTYHQLMLENHTLFSKHVFRRLADCQLSSGQPRVLEYLMDHEGAMQKEIAKACMIEPPSVTSVLSKMEREGLIVRSAKAGDRRSQDVALTQRGRELAALTAETFRQEEAAALQGLSREERETLVGLLERVNRNLREAAEGTHLAAPSTGEEVR